MTHEELKQAQEQAFAPFRDRILEIFLDPEKGLEYFDSIEIPRDRVYEIIAPNSFSLVIKGDMKDKERVVIFKRLFSQQDGSIEILHDLLDLVLPESIKRYKKELVRARSLDHDAKLYIVNGLLRDLESASLMEVSKFAIEIALERVSQAQDSGTESGKN